MTFQRGVLTVALAVVSVAVLGPLTATADPPPPPPPPPTANLPTGTGAVAYVNATVNGRPISIARLGTCATDGTHAGFTPGVQVHHVIIGWGMSVCRTDGQRGVTVDVTGSGLEINALRPSGGPPVRLGRYTVNCHASPYGTWSTMQLTTMFGAWLPNPIPPNYTMVIPGRLPTDAPRGRIVLNEQIRGPAPGRTLTVNALHLQVFRQGTANTSGDFVAGSVHCSPHSRVESPPDVA